MKIIKMPKKNKENEKNNSYFRENDCLIEAITWPISKICKLDEIQMGDIIITFNQDNAYSLYELLRRRDYIFSYFYLVNLHDNCVIYGGNSLEEIVKWAKINLDNFRNAKQILVLRPKKLTVKSNNGPHLVK